jgi:Rrf2 family protein
MSMIEVVEMPQTVEWALHCCWLLAQSSGESPLPRRRIAEFFDLPEPYLAKALKHLVSAGILVSVPGVNGGYRLARPADRITALEVVQAMRAESSMFRCTEIRQNGPVGLTPPQCDRPCGIAKLMHQAELAWRGELARTTIAQLVENAPDVSEQRAAKWLGPQSRLRQPVADPG